MENREVLNQLINAYWLRPESALFRYFDYLNSEKFKFTSPSLDLGCGDGVLNFIRNGGKFDKNFSVFLNTTNTNFFFDNVDVYNAKSEKVKKYVKSKPKKKIDYGLDHKNLLLNKANDLGLYDNLIKSDANKKLPFLENQFSSIFSNILYWLENPLKTLDELVRVLDYKGRLCIFLPDEKILQNSFFIKYYKETGNKNYKFLKYIDRGKFSNKQMRSILSISTYEKYFNSNNLKVLSKKGYMSNTFVKIWDIGFRPFFPVFSQLDNYIKKKNRLKFKKLWIDNLYRFANPLISLEKKNNKEFNFYCYILEKKYVRKIF